MGSLAASRAALAAYQSIHSSLDGREGNLVLIEMLLDGLAASLAGIRNADMRGDGPGRSEYVERASRIVVGLEKALDSRFNPDVASSLGFVYRYMLKRLDLSARGGADSQWVGELLALTNKIRSAFLRRD
jgi:flagellar biosynthetic protein FliS